MKQHLQQNIVLQMTHEQASRLDHILTGTLLTEEFKLRAVLADLPGVQAVDKIRQLLHIATTGDQHELVLYGAGATHVSAHKVAR